MSDKGIWDRSFHIFENYILYIILFSPHVIFPFAFAQTKLWIKKDGLRLKNSPSIKFACWQQGRKGRKKNGGEYFPVYSICSSKSIKFTRNKIWLDLLCLLKTNGNLKADHHWKEMCIRIIWNILFMIVIICFML